MIDGSHHSFEKNIGLTKQVVDYAHERDVSVEGELGVLSGVEDAVSSEVSHYTKPSEVEEFLARTSVDSLAISIGTSHGAYKFKLKPGEHPPSLRFDILEEIERRIPGFPIVLHGASTVMPEYVAMINKFGGMMEEAVGIPEEQLRRAAGSAVCKINIDSDGRLAMTAIIRKVFAEKPGEFDPRKYLGPARDELVRMIKHKNEHVLGSAGRA
jgi:fructose-bisphosphate aldolase, class II